MALYKTQQDDRIDRIVLAHYGDLEMLEAVIEANPELHQRELILDEGIELTLPDAAPKQTAPHTPPPGTPLW